MRTRIPSVCIIIVCALSPAVGAAAAGGFELSGEADRARGDYRRYCATCHGAEGKGDGVMARVLDPRPKDFTDRAYMSTRSDQQLYLAIKEGGESVGLSDKMAPWKHILSDQQIHDLTLLVRKLGTEAAGR